MELILGKRNAYFCAMKWAAILGSLFTIGLASGQTDSLLAPSSLPPLRVQIHLDTSLVDSLWSDSAWTWSGACPAPSITVRLTDSTSGLVAQRTLPCTTVSAQEVSSAYVRVEPEDWRLDLALDRKAVSSWNWTTPSACFPPMSAQVLERAATDWDRLIFERDQLEAMALWAADRCLAPSMVRQCLLRLESEDKRLELLKALAPRCSQPRSIDVSDLFILRATRAEAGQVVGN